MIVLERSVRFVVNPPGLDGLGTNGYAANPPLRRLAPYHELQVTCRGEIDPVIGYLINIKDIDEVVRECALPRITSAVWASPNDAAAGDPAWALFDLVESIGRNLSVPLACLRWHITPFVSLQMDSATTDRVTLRIKFDFSASHRLYVKEWSDEKNFEVFGKCAHPSGHGHNYELEPAIELPAEASVHAAAERIEVLVKSVVIDRFDHKHLDLDTAEFGDNGVNSTVENIAKVCFDLIEPALQDELPEARLASVTAWETPRTSATFVKPSR